MFHVKFFLGEDEYQDTWTDDARFVDYLIKDTEIAMHPDAKLVVEIYGQRSSFEIHPLNPVSREEII